MVSLNSSTQVDRRFDKNPKKFLSSGKTMPKKGAKAMIARAETTVEIRHGR